MGSLVLGQLLDPRKHSYPETTQLHLYRDFAELVLFMNKPTSQEKRDVTEGNLQFALADGAPHLFILGYQFGSQSWCDAPFEAHRATDAGTVLETAGDLLPLRVLLVDANTGILVGWRFCELPPDFADAMRASVQAQLGSPYEPDTAGALLNHLYQHFPTPKALLDEFASVTCRLE
jgi:hypothetical protein